MQYKTRYTFAKIDQDLAPDKRDTSTHYDIVNFEVFLTERGASLVKANGPGGINDAGKLAGLYVIGDVTVGDQCYIWTTDNNAAPSKASVDSIWELEDTVVGYTVTLVQTSNWSLTTLNPIQSIGIDENVNSRKLYWVDALNQARFINVKDPSPDVDFVKPNDDPGTVFTTSSSSAAVLDAVVRYAYTTYDVGGSESKISFFSDRFSLKERGASARIDIDFGTPVYENYRIYRVMWQAYNDAPSYSIIDEGVIPADGNLTNVIDNGTRFLSSIALEDLVSLGSDVIVPSAINSKKNILFLGNYRSTPFTVDPQVYDLRAFFHNLAAAPADRIRISTGLVSDSFPDFNGIPYDHNAIADNTGSWATQADGTLGAEGPYTKIYLETVSPNISRAKKVYKSNETYRIGVVCKDELGRETPAYWICDITIPAIDDANASPRYWTIRGQLKTAPPGVVSYKFVYVERTQENKSVLGQAIVQPLMDYRLVGDVPDGIFPYPTMREIKSDDTVGGDTIFDMRVDYSPGIDFKGTQDGASYVSDMKMLSKQYQILYSPEILLYQARLPITQLGIVGVQEISDDLTRFGAWGPTADIAEEDTFPGTLHDLRSSLATSTIFPEYLFQEFNDGNNDAYAMFMYYRMCDKHHTNTVYSPEDVDIAEYVGQFSTVALDDVLVQNLINKIKFAGSVANTGWDPSNYQANYGAAYLVKMNAANWADDAGNYKKFSASGNFNSTPLNRGLPIVDMLQELPNQYGGNTFDDRSFNNYIDCSRGSVLFSDNISSAVELQGDVYCGLYAFAKTSGAQEYSSVAYSSVYDYIFVFMESEIDMNESNRLVRESATQLAGGSNLKFFDIPPFYDYNAVFSQIPNYNLTTASRFNSQNITEFPTRITPSNIKSVGETIDSWTKINTGTYLDLESPFGPITSLERVNNEVIAFQPRAIAGISILPDSQVASSTGQLQLGKGNVLDNYSYLTIENGAENFQAIAVYGEDVYFIDTIKKSFNSLKGGEISVLKGFNTLVKGSLLSNAKEYLVNTQNGAFVFINNAKKQVLFRFSASKPVLVFNAALQEFTNSRTYEQAYYFLQHRDNVLSAYGDDLYVNDKGTIGTYYGTLNVPSKLITLTEPMPGVDKVFDAISLLQYSSGTNLTIFNQVKVESPTRTSGLVPIEFKEKYDLYNAYLPRVQDSRQRFRERSIKLTLQHDDAKYLAIDELFIKYSIKKA